MRTGRHPVEERDVAALEHQPQLLAIHPPGLMEAVIKVDQDRPVVTSRRLHVLLDRCPRPDCRPAPTRPAQVPASRRTGRRNARHARRRFRRSCSGPRTSARRAGSRPKRNSRTCHARTAPSSARVDQPADRPVHRDCSAASGSPRSADRAVGPSRSAPRPGRSSGPAASRRSRAFPLRAPPFPAHGAGTAAWRCRRDRGLRVPEKPSRSSVFSTPNRAAAASEAG